MRKDGPRRGKKSAPGGKGRSPTSASRHQPPKLRIVGGEFRGRKIDYHGDRRTRPMKDRVREAVFNLVGPVVKDTLALDLFAGTGAMALEALSRGAGQAIAIERHFPSVECIKSNMATLQVTDRMQVVAADTFNWVRDVPLETTRPWLVFCCPPYDFYASRADDLEVLLHSLADRAPRNSLFVVESDRHLETTWLPDLDWDIRRYPPAVIAIGEVVAAEPDSRLS